MSTRLLLSCTTLAGVATCELLESELLVIPNARCSRALATVSVKSADGSVNTSLNSVSLYETVNEVTTAAGLVCRCDASCEAVYTPAVTVIAVSLPLRVSTNVLWPSTTV
jgi:hypothetical protein